MFTLQKNYVYLLVNIIILSIIIDISFFVNSKYNIFYFVWIATLTLAMTI